MLILELNCESASFLSLLKIVANFIRYIYVGIVVLLIIYTMIDIMKTVMSDKVDTGASIKMFIKKIISAVLVFLLIPIVLFAIDLFVPTKNNSKFFSCTDTVTKALLNPSSIEIPEDTDNTTEEPAE